MKYIRTTNFIDKIVKESCCYYSPQPKCWHLKDHYLVKEDDKDFPKYRFSDTIEELLDELIAVTDDGRHIRLRSRFDLMGSGSYIERTYMIDCPYKVYGAIWTKGGLIYVAKMNEKGDLELL